MVSWWQFPFRLVVWRAIGLCRPANANSIILVNFLYNQLPCCSSSEHTHNFLSIPGHLPGAPQSQQTSLPGIRLTSPRMALVSSCTMLFSPTCWSPLKALLSASSLLFCNTEIHLRGNTEVIRGNR